MAILKKNAFSRRVPDLVTEELVAVLSRRASFEFKQLFDIVHAGRKCSGCVHMKNCRIWSHAAR